MTLKTRKPTGIVPAPNILCEGEEGSGKTYAAFALSASDKVGTTYVIDIGEGCADQYADLGDYLVVEHDGTIESLREQARAIAKLPVDPDCPPVVIVDSVSTLWDMVKNGAEQTARERARRNAEKYRKPFDPDADVNITMDIWNAAGDRFYSVIEPLLDWAGICILTARGKWAVEVANGQPTKNQVWSPEYQKRLGFSMDVVLRFTQPRTVQITKARTLKLNLPAEKFLTVPAFTMEKLIFDMLQVTSAPARQITRPAADQLEHTPTEEAPVFVLDGEQTITVAEGKALIKTGLIAAGIEEAAVGTYGASIWKQLPESFRTKGRPGFTAAEAQVISDTVASYLCLEAEVGAPTPEEQALAGDPHGPID